MAMTNKYGERGFLCLKPLLILINLCNFPLREIEAVAVEIHSLIHENNVGGNPKLIKRLIRKGQEIESKAFLISTISILLGVHEFLPYFLVNC